MSEQTASQAKLAAIICEALEIDDVAPSEIVASDPLFGEGLGLDSIDGLEIALAVSQNYGVELKADDDNNKAVFSSLESLDAYIQQNS